MKLIKIATLVVGMVPVAYAAPTTFSDTLKGYVGEDTLFDAVFLEGTGLEPAEIGINPAIEFNANGAKFGIELTPDPAIFNDGWDTRNFLRTTEEAFGTVNFISFVTVQRDFIPENGINGYGAIYFGLGSGIPRWYRTPDGQDQGALSKASTFFRLQAQGFFSWHAGLSGQNDNEITELGFGFEPQPRTQGTFRLMMAYDADGKTVTYAIDYEYDGTFAPEQTVSFPAEALVNEFKGGERSSIYFGSNGEVSFSDFSVEVLPAGPSGAVSFVNDLKGLAGNDTAVAAPPFLLGTGLEASSSGIDSKITFTGAGAVFGTDPLSDDWQQRNYLRTTAQNYGSVGFTAAVTAQRDFVPDDGPDGDGAIYFGLGSGEARFFREPDGADGGFLSRTSSYLRWQSQPFLSWHAGEKGGVENVPEIGFEFELPDELEARRQGVTRLSMTYDPVGKTIVYGIDYDYDGVFSADQTFPIIDVTTLEAGFSSGDRASIFFGSNAGVVFSDFAVEVAASDSPYDDWAQGAAFEADANADGVPNGIAWILGAADPSDTALSRLPTVGTEEGFLILSFQRIPELGSAELSVEFSSDLGITDPWTAVDVLAGPLGSVVVTETPGSPLNNLVVKIPTSEASPSGKLFARLQAVR